jgi:hypothetical protein
MLPKKSPTTAILLLILLGFSTSQAVEETKTIPKGEYYIGDLCYVIDREWSNVVDLYFQSQKNNPEKKFHELNYTNPMGTVVNAIMLFTGSDGTYFIQNKLNNKKETPICMDSGTIGIVRTDMLNPQTLKDNSFLGHIVKFEGTTTISYQPDQINIGDLKIRQED